MMTKLLVVVMAVPLFSCGASAARLGQDAVDGPKKNLDRPNTRTLQDDSLVECISGVPGIRNKDICCHKDCGECGGGGCGQIPGLDSTDCCTGKIQDTGDPCSVTGKGPCVMDEDSEDVVSSGYSDLGCYWYDEVNDTTFNDNFGILTSSPLNEYCYNRCMNTNVSPYLHVKTNHTYFATRSSGDSTHCMCGSEEGFLVRRKSSRTCGNADAYKLFKIDGEVPNQCGHGINGIVAEESTDGSFACCGLGCGDCNMDECDESSRGGCCPDSIVTNPNIINKECSRKGIAPCIVD